MKNVKKKNKMIAAALSISMIAAFLPCGSVYAEEVQTSGTFNEIFSWNFSGDTMTFSVDESCTERVEMTTGSKLSAYVSPWKDISPQIKHVVLDPKIDNLGHDIVNDLYDYADNYETITCGEYFDVNNSWFWGSNENMTVIAPKNSYADYTAFVAGAPFEPDGVAENPYLYYEGSDGHWTYLEDQKILKLNEIIDDDVLETASRWHGRYNSVLVGENAVLAIGDGTMSGHYRISHFKNYILKGVDKPTCPYYDTKFTLCYPSFGEDNISYLRERGEKVAVLGEANPELKGDADLDGEVKVSDASAVLEYCGKKAVGLDAAFKDDAELDKFSCYLADTDTEGKDGSEITVSDAANILTYYGQKAVGLEPSWENILNS